MKKIFIVTDSIIFILMLIFITQVYSYPIAVFNGKLINVYSIYTDIRLDIYNVSWLTMSIASDGKYLYFLLSSIGGRDLYLIKFDPQMNEVIYNSTITFSQDIIRMGIQYLNGYVYIFVDYILENNAHSIIEIRDANNLDNVISTYNLTTVFNAKSSWIDGVRKEREMLIVSGKIFTSTTELFISIINGTSFKKIKTFNIPVDILPFVVYNGTHYLSLGINSEELKSTYIVFDKDLNIVYSKPLGVFWLFDIWSNGLILGTEKYIIVTDWNVNPIKTYYISYFVNVSDCFVDYINVVNDVIVTVVDTVYTDYYPKIIVAIDLNTDNTETYMLNTAISYPIATNLGFYDHKNNLLLYPAYHILDNDTVYLSAVAVSIIVPITTTTPAETTTTPAKTLTTDIALGLIVIGVIGAILIGTFKGKKTMSRLEYFKKERKE